MRYTKSEMNPYKFNMNISLKAKLLRFEKVEYIITMNRELKRDKDKTPRPRYLRISFSTDICSMFVVNRKTVFRAYILGALAKFV